MKFAGAYRGMVVDTRDPANRGSIKAKIPVITGDSTSEWIPPLVSGGYVVTPPLGSQVWIVFEAGDVNFPLWIGSTKTDPEYNRLINRIKTLETQMAAVQAYIETHP